MKKPNHNQFIQTSITKILEEMITASRGVGDGIETYAVYDYILQSTFLKMTGAQEQKFKCICWELATNDYEYRREFLRGKEKGMSHYDDKQNVYLELIEQIKKNDFSFNVNNFFAETIENNSKKIGRKKKIRKDICFYIKQVFENTNFAIWGKKYYRQFYVFIATLMTEKHFATAKHLFVKPNEIQKSLCDIYTQLYHHRNRCAHNTLSYQQNLPTLDTLRKEEYKYENYFVYFSILILIDEIIMALYRKYLEVLE